MEKRSLTPEEIAGNQRVVANLQFLAGEIANGNYIVLDAPEKATWSTESPTIDSYLELYELRLTLKPNRIIRMPEA